MIAFDLQCANGHTFEGWFEDADAYEKQRKEGLINCPVCNDVSIARIPSTFAIKNASASPVGEIPDHQVALMALNQKISEYVEKNFDDVGTDFASEALKIHYGVAEPRNIRGVSSEAEEKTLRKEGVEFFKIPLATVPHRKTH